MNLCSRFVFKISGVTSMHLSSVASISDFNVLTASQNELLVRNMEEL